MTTLSGLEAVFFRETPVQAQGAHPSRGRKPRPVQRKKVCHHAEGKVTERMVYIVTTREAIPLMQALMPREPKGPFPSFDPPPSR